MDRYETYLCLNIFWPFQLKYKLMDQGYEQLFLHITEKIKAIHNTIKKMV